MDNSYRENLAWYLTYGRLWQSYQADTANNLVAATQIGSRSEADNVAWVANMVSQDRYYRHRQR